MAPFSFRGSDTNLLEFIIIIKFWQDFKEIKLKHKYSTMWFFCSGG